jgi:hypothetical protein
VSGGTASSIDTGVLTVGTGETARPLTGRAVSMADPSPSVSATVQVTEAEPGVQSPVVTRVILSPRDAVVTVGNWKLLTATVEGLNNPSQAVSWKVEEGGVPLGASTITAGVLTVGSEEFATSLRITATSLANNAYSATVTVYVTPRTLALHPASPGVTVGQTQQFTVEAVNPGSSVTLYTDVTWSVGGGTVSSIDQAGLLRVGAQEKVNALLVTATSKADTSVYASTSVEVKQLVPTVGGVTITPNSPSVVRGGKQTFTAAVGGANAPSQEVMWSVKTAAGGVPAYSTIHLTGGVLEVGEREPATSLVVTATSKTDTSKTGSVTVTVTPSMENGLYHGAGNDRVRQELIHGTSISVALAWLADNDDTYGAGKTYTYRGASGSLAPFNLNTTAGSITLILEGGEITLNGRGSLFTVGKGVTLVLQDVSLKALYAGMSNNTATANHNTKSLVTVENGATFEMRGNSSVHGNVIQPDQSNVVVGDPIFGGGVLVEAQAVFSMYNTSSVYGNRIAHPIADLGGYMVYYVREQNTKTKALVNPNIPTQTTCADLYGGGVATFGTFTMYDDASVKDNHIRGELKAYGGGVFVGEYSLSDPNSNNEVYVQGGQFYMRDRAKITGNSVFSRDMGVIPGWSMKECKYISPAKWEAYWYWNRKWLGHSAGGSGVATMGVFTMNGGTISSNTGCLFNGKDNVTNMAPDFGTQVRVVQANAFSMIGPGTTNAPISR